MTESCYDEFMSLTETTTQTAEAYCSHCGNPGAWIEPGMEDGYPIARAHMEGGIYHVLCYDKAKRETPIDVLRLQLALALALATL